MEQVPQKENLVASLTVIKGPDRGKRFEVSAEVPSIGRDPRNAIRLHDSEISRKHAEIRRTDKGYVIYDLQSSNGTYVNGKRVKYSQIRTGDRVVIGQSEMIFTAGAEPHAPSELAAKINMIARNELSESSAIISRIKQSEGSQILRHPELAGSRWLKDALTNLAVMYETSEAISRISDIDQLLNHIMQRVFASIQPDRGCIMLQDADTGEFTPTAVHYAENVDNEEQMSISQTIVDWVLKRNEGVIVLDAAHDERFGAAQSIVKLGIREAICVPLAGRHETLGVMYIDIKSDSKDVLETQKPIKFNDDHLKLMIAIAHQAGLAIEDSRFYQAMVQAERLAAVGQTIASLSHHIKNILQGLRAGSYVLEMGLEEEKLDLVRKGWTTVQKNQDKIYNLVMDMLSYSKDREPALEMVELNHIVKEVAELMEPRAKDFNAKLEVNLAEHLPPLAADPDGIHRALLNIVTNAIDAVEGVPRACVVIETSLDPSGRYQHIAIRDNGVGVPESRKEYIFQIFNSTKGERGSGLGLAVSQKILHEHNGQIRLESELGKGSCFTLDIPVRKLEPSQSDSGDIDMTIRTQFTEED